MFRFFDVEDRLVATGASDGRSFGLVWSDKAGRWLSAPGSITSPGPALSKAVAAKAFPRADFKALNALSNAVPETTFE